MARPFTKAWKYVLALFDNAVEEHADPKVQIEQAIDDAKRQHQELSRQAAVVIGQQHQLEMKLNRQLGEIEKLDANVRQALKMAEQARAEGNATKAGEYEAAAAAFSAQLVTAEHSIEDLKTLYEQSTQAAAQAKDAVERNAAVLESQLAERTTLLNQLDQVIMQEKVANTVQQLNATTRDTASPTLDDVREKIEARYARALGAAELADAGVHHRMAEIEARSGQYVANNRLEEIKAQMQAKGEISGPSSQKPELTAE